MKKINLNSEEQKLLDAVEAGEFESVLNDNRKAEIERTATETLKEKTTKQAHANRK